MGEGARGARLKSSNYDLYRHCYWKKLTVSLRSPEALYYHLLTRKAARNALGESFFSGAFQDLICKTFNFKHLFIMTNINLKSIILFEKNVVQQFNILMLAFLAATLEDPGLIPPRPGCAYFFTGLHKQLEDKNTLIYHPN